jgi:hypothetical protein
VLAFGHFVPNDLINHAVSSLDASVISCQDLDTNRDLEGLFSHIRTIHRLFKASVSAVAWATEVTTLS